MSRAWYCGKCSDVKLATRPPGGLCKCGDRLWLPTDVGQALAIEFCQLIEPYCERVKIAGSMRRGVARIKDFDIVAVPKVEETGEGERDLFTGEIVSKRQRCLLLSFLDELDVSGEIVRDEAKPCWGKRNRRFTWKLGGLVDLYMVRHPATFGVMYALRTGPWDFSRDLVSRHLLPDGFKFSNGVLSRDGVPIKTDTEAELFRAIDLPAKIPPAGRTVSGLRLMRKAANAFPTPKPKTGGTQHGFDFE